MPSVADQFSVSHALVPFAVALFFIAWAAWYVCEWRYRAVIEKMKEMDALRQIEVDHWKDAAARNATQASDRLELAKKKNQAEAVVLLDEAHQSLSRVKSDLDELGKANTSPFHINLSNLRGANITWSTSTTGATRPSAPDRPTDDK